MGRYSKNGGCILKTGNIKFPLSCGVVFCNDSVDEFLL